MGTLELLEENQREIFYGLENHDFTFLVSVGVVPFLRFVSKVENTKYLFISDDTTRLSERFKDLPYQSSMYDDRFSVVKSCWLTYDLVMFLMSEDARFLELFDFVIFDSLDECRVNSDILLSLVVNSKMKGKFIALQRSGHLLEKYTEYISQFGYTSTVLRLTDQDPISRYFLPDLAGSPSESSKSIVSTVNDILSNNKGAESYDILVLLSSLAKIEEVKTKILDSPIDHDYSILTDITKYKPKGPHRRIILAIDTKWALDTEHKIRFIVDSGLISRPNELLFNELIMTNENQISQHTAILNRDESSYFGVFQKTGIVDAYYAALKEFSLPHLLYLMKFDVFHPEKNFEFFKAPNVEKFQQTVSLGVYLGLIIIKVEDGKSSFKLTSVGETVMKFQIELNLLSVQLFTSLAVSGKYQCTKEILKMIAILLTSNASYLSRMIHKEPMLRNNSVPQSDFRTLVNMFDSIIVDEQHVKPSGGRQATSWGSKFDKKERKRVLHVYQTLKQRLNYTMINMQGATTDEDNIHRCLFTGFQLNAGKVVKNVSNNSGSVELSVESVVRRSLTGELEMEIPRHQPIISLPTQHDSYLTEYSEDDIIIYLLSKYKIYNNNYQSLLQ